MCDYHDKPVHYTNTTLEVTDSRIYPQVSIANVISISVLNCHLESLKYATAAYIYDRVC